MITDFSFGRIVVEGQTLTGDIKIVQGQLVPDWWRRSGHSVDIDDVQDVLASDSDILVIDRGQPGYMKVSPSLRQELENQSISVPAKKQERGYSKYPIRPLGLFRSPEGSLLRLFFLFLRHTSKSLLSTRPTRLAAKSR